MSDKVVSGKKFKPRKCIICKKRNITNLKCKCKKTVCLAHRFPSSHSCAFNWVEEGKKQLKKDLIDAIPDKLIKV